jgi:hypothetical protein
VAIWIAVGFVCLWTLFGLIDLRAAITAQAKGLGAAGLILAAGASSFAAFHALSGGAESLGLVVLAGGGVAMALGLLGDFLADLRTRSFQASLSVATFAWLLPGSVGETPTVGGVLFVAAIAVMIGSVTGLVLRKIIGRFLFGGPDDDDELEGEAER